MDQSVRLAYYTDSSLPELPPVQLTELQDLDALREALRYRRYELLLFSMKEPDPVALKIAVQQAKLSGPGIMLLTAPKRTSEIAAEAPGVFVLSDTVPAEILRQVLEQLLFLLRQQRKMRSSVDNLQSELSDLKVIQRAKLLLITRLKMSEEQAHRYIEKTAMDSCIKRREVAETIIRTYEF